MVPEQAHRARGRAEKPEKSGKAGIMREESIKCIKCINRASPLPYEPVLRTGGLVASLCALEGAKCVTALIMPSGQECTKYSNFAANPEILAGRPVNEASRPR